MPRLLFDSPYLFGIHEPGGEPHMLAAGKPGWILFSEVLGHDPADQSGVDYSSYSNQGLGILVRLNHGYEPEGTIPHSSQYEVFARRVANFVGTSRGARIWIIGNEMNYAAERPGIKIDWSRHASQRSGPPGEADPTRRGLAVRFNALPDPARELRSTRGAIISPGEVITPDLYARCYRLCRDAVHRLPGHEDDLVLVGAVAPWNTQTIYPGNPNGDWVQYFHDILMALGPEHCDGFALHAYTHGADPSLVASPARMAPPFQSRHQHFRTYLDFLGAVPAEMRHLAAFIAEAGQVQPWVNQNLGWVQALYGEVDVWNRQPTNQQIRAVVLYRWPVLDRWHIDGKQEVIDDFCRALANDYQWRGATAVAAATRSDAAQPAIEPAIGTPAETAPAPVAETTPPVVPARERRERARKAPPAPPYAIEWVSDTFPARLTAGQIIVVPISVRNGGTMTWSWGGGNPFRLGYRYYRNRKMLPLLPAKDLRTDVPDDVMPGQTVVIPARIALPDEPGNYTLELDLVQEGVTWFKERGATVLTRWLTVEPPQPDEQSARRDDVKLPVRLFTDISTRLPRSAAPYARRNMNQVRYIVVSQTGAHPLLSLDRIARAHVKCGYPGIAYDFVVDSAGEILKVKDIENVAQPDQVWSEQGVNVCLAGLFDSVSPPLAQLDAAGRLCAWLAQNLGMSADAIVGLGELISSESPGETFYKGPRWKDILARQVRLHLAALSAGAGDSERNAEVDRLLAEVRTHNQALVQQVEALTRHEAEMERTLACVQADLTEAQRQLEEQPATGESGAGGLRMLAVYDRLPRDARRYRLRSDEAVRYIVIHDTGAPADTALEELAKVHRREWPGLLYDFVIDSRGVIRQTQPLDAVPDTPEPYVREAISIAFAGDFRNGGAPTPDQLAAAGRLMTWLMLRYPGLTLDAVKGVNEFVATPSPGREWEVGRAWKRALLMAARRASGGSDVTAIEAPLRDQIVRLEQSLMDQEAALARAEEARFELNGELQRMRKEAEARAAVSGSYVVPPPPLRNLVDQLPRHVKLRYERRSLSQITHIAIHHTAAPPRVGPARIAELHIAADPSRGKEAWPGIGYHFFVHEDGIIDQTNQLETASYHLVRHYGYSAGIVFAGSFMNGKIPTSTQLRSGAHLVAWLMQELKIPLARVWGHREFPDNMTVCPGGEWTQGNRWRDLLFERIGQIQQGAGLKTMRHYMLFPPGDGAAGELFVDALSFMARFRPTVGFSVEEARGAEYVTIVGSEAGISAVSANLLADAGCKVERIAGRTDGETGRLLAEMVRVGRRFRDYEVDF